MSTSSLPTIGELLAEAARTLPEPFTRTALINWVRARRPDVAVLDIGMPPPDGIEVVRRIRADSDLHGMQLLLLTAKAQDSDVRTGFEAGADAYVRKPFSPAELSARVRELVGD